MSGVVVDTHALIWLLMSPARLSSAAHDCLNQSVERGDPIFVPTICLVEIAYLIEKRRLDAAVWQRIVEVVAAVSGTFSLAALTLETAEALRSVPGAEIPDMPDRIIAATALSLGVPLITRDRRISASKVQTIW